VKDDRQTNKDIVMVTKFQKQLAKLNTCSEAIKWVKNKTAKEAWDTCQRGDWMLQLIGKTDKSNNWSKERKPLVQIALDCAMLVEPHFSNNNNNQLAFIWCVDATQRWIDGENNRKEVEAAQSAIYDAADSVNTRVSSVDLSVINYVTVSSCYIIIHAIDAIAYAVNTTSNSTIASAIVSRVADAANMTAITTSAATYDIHRKINKRCANIVRSYLPKPPKMQ
jgi:hypothetical protein